MSTPQSGNDLHIGILCGGPSGERGISLNSARSLLDHLGGLGCKLSCFYLSPDGDFYALDNTHMYSNTPLDFDFKLAFISEKLDQGALQQKWSALDLLFPAIHGTMGEDGAIQKLCEKWDIPYAGSPPEACARCFDKQTSHDLLQKLGFDTVPYLALAKGQNKEQILEASKQFVGQTKASSFAKIDNRFVVKPATGGSSLDVFQAHDAEQIADCTQKILGKDGYSKVIVEPFCDGVEFTVILLETADGVKAMPPSEIATSYDEGAFFDYRKKYMPNTAVHYHCPPRFAKGVTDTICTQAEKIFAEFGMRDFARFDGWLLAGGQIVFSDLNPISGMEQNSFLFQQPAYLGLAHSDTLACVVQSALRKNGRDWTPRKSSEESSTKTKLPILFGGVTAERQVSLMSGTNAWMKLRGSSTFSPTPYFLSGQKTLTQIPYAFCLAHTVEEISTAIESYEQIKLRLQPFEQELGPVFSKMGLLSEDASFHAPAKHDLYEFVSVQSFVFSGLHGGIGENGTLQAALEAKDIRFNGPGSDASRICMDKLLSSQKLEKLEQEGIYTISKHSAELPPQISNAQGTAAELWAKATEVIGSSVLIVKPQDEGCSAGIVKLQSAGELEKYLYYLEEGAHYIPIGEVGNHSPIEMPPMRMQKLLFEEFIETDRVWTEGKNLRWEKRTGWVEVTVGILERNGELISLTPSMSVASGDVLSVEEKFQGGTGINLTPPPHPQVSLDAVEKVKRANVIIAKTLGLTSYSRTDLFMHTETGKVKFIEVNTTPALTPSTVLYHQALAEDPPLAPRQFLELLITEAKRAPSASA